MVWEVVVTGQELTEDVLAWWLQHRQCMGGIERFEDIAAWQHARRLASRVYKTSRQGALRKDFGLRNQICRAAVSVMANIAEGFGRKTDKDFANFLYNAKGSALEVISHIYVALDQSYIDREEFNTLRTGYDKVIRMLVNLIRHLESDPKRSRY
jgi:four helix bundle protein